MEHVDPVEYVPVWHFTLHVPPEYWHDGTLELHLSEPHAELLCKSNFMCILFCGTNYSQMLGYNACKLILLVEVTASNYHIRIYFIIRIMNMQVEINQTVRKLVAGSLNILDMQHNNCHISIFKGV